MTALEVTLIYIAAVNIVAFATFGADKSKARRKKRRIRERSLFLISAVGGALGALFGMKVFRHKTKHKSFTFGIPAILIFQVIIFAVLYQYGIIEQMNKIILT